MQASRPLPPDEQRKFLQAFERFIGIIARLRNPDGGCPWDVKQTLETLRPLLLEEAYEVADAVDSSPKAVCEELGDLVSVIALCADIGRVSHNFDWNDILTAISEKLIRRHPHVFGDLKVDTSEEVLKNWEVIKAQERKSSEKDKEKSLVDGLPQAMPALLKAHRLGEKCARVGFDWSDARSVISKVREELNELLEAIQNGSGTATEEELGDLLFTIAQMSRHLNLNAEMALGAANRKFTARFKTLEQLAANSGVANLADLSPDRLEELWGEAKKAAAL